MLQIKDITISFDEQPVLHGVSLKVQPGEIVCLLGPSGCGKSTLLRIIAGLEVPGSGDVRLAGRSILREPVHKRGFGLMFQDFALFPHMSVGENIAFGLRMQRLPEQEQQRRAQAALALVGLAGFADRDVTALSGGEKQRVALARSLAPEPRLLMLDEPLGSVDATLRDQLVVELRTIIKQAGLTAIYVTHDQAEAFAIADRVAVMHMGRIQQVGQPEAVYRQPRTAFVARFLGLENVIPVMRQEGNRVHTALGAFTVAGPATSILLHPDGLTLAEDAQEGALAAEITARVFLGDAYRLVLRPAGTAAELVMRCPSGAEVPAAGSTVQVRIDPAAVLPLA